MLGHTLFLFEIIHFLPSPAILADIVYIIYIVYNVYNLQSRMAKCLHVCESILDICPIKSNNNNNKAMMFAILFYN